MQKNIFSLLLYNKKLMTWMWYVQLILEFMRSATSGHTRLHTRLHTHTHLHTHSHTLPYTTTGYVHHLTQILACDSLTESLTSVAISSLLPAVVMCSHHLSEVRRHYACPVCSVVCYLVSLQLIMILLRSYKHNSINIFLLL